VHRRTSTFRHPGSSETYTVLSTIDAERAIPALEDTVELGVGIGSEAMRAGGGGGGGQLAQGLSEQATSQDTALSVRSAIV